jgi:hypothetical protein
MLLVSAERAAQRVEQKPFRLVNGFLGEMLELQTGRPA